MSRLRFLLPTLSCLLFPLVEVGAHDVFEITTDARLRVDRLELKITMAWSTAMLATHEGRRPQPWIPPEDFAGRQEFLTARAATFFAVAVGEKVLAPREVVVGLTVENDLEVFLVFPPPRDGDLRLTAAILGVLPPEGYGSVLTMIGSKGEFLGQETLWRDAPSFVVPAATIAP